MKSYRAVRRKRRCSHRKLLLVVMLTLTAGGADAALAASLFHYKELEIRDLKSYLRERGIPVRL